MSRRAPSCGSGARGASRAPAARFAGRAAAWALAAAFLGAALPGCALTSRGEPLHVRYFDPVVAPSGPAWVDPAAAVPACALELGDVTSSADLGENIVYRKSPYEVGYYETRRWRERPERYLQRALEHELFDELRCRRIASGAAPTLDVELTAFEEQPGPLHGARVAVRLKLTSGRAVLLEDSVNVIRRISGPRPGDGDGTFDDVVRAIGRALDEVATRVARAASAAAVAGSAADAGAPPASAP